MWNEDIDKTRIEVKQLYNNYSIAELASGDLNRLKIGLSVVGIESETTTNKNEKLQLSIENSPNAQQNIGENINITNVYENKKIKEKKKYDVNKLNHFFVDLMVSADNRTRPGIGAGYNFYPQLTETVNNFIEIGFNINALFLSTDALVLYGFEDVSSRNWSKDHYNIPEEAIISTNYANKISLVPSVYMKFSLLPKQWSKNQKIFLGIGYSFYNIEESVSYTLNSTEIFSQTVKEEYGPDFMFEYQNRRIFINIKYRKGTQYENNTGTDDRSNEMDYGLGEVTLGFLF